MYCRLIMHEAPRSGDQWPIFFSATPGYLDIFIVCYEEVLEPVDPRDVLYTKTRLRTPLTDQSLRRPPHRKKCTRTATCFIVNHPGTEEWNQVVFSDESRFNLCSGDNRVRVWRPRGERLNPAFALQRHTAPTAGVKVWGAIAYNTRSPLVLIRGTMTAQWYVHDILKPHVLSLMQRLPDAIFQQDNARPHTARVYPDFYYSSLASPIPRFVSIRAYLGSFGTASWAS
ncbi:uncharacterized protein TNCV_420971 [Trichonephila clavipes]|nr:uncharacterized protein TNCV_420971 [Trichonephila clavipes]